MSDVRTKIKNRRCYPVDLGDGNIVHCRALTIGELKRLEALPKEDKTPFVMGCAITNDNGVQEFAPEAGEGDDKYVARLRDELADVDTETIAKITATISKIGKVPEVDTLKNS